MMPHLVECCHAYATVGEMVAALKSAGAEGIIEYPLNKVIY